MSVNSIRSSAPVDLTSAGADFVYEVRPSRGTRSGTHYVQGAPIKYPLLYSLLLVSRQWLKLIC